MQCPQCHKICEPDHRFCSYCGTALPRVSTPADDARFTHLTSSTPEPLAHKMRAAHISGERKVVTFLFADVVGSTAIAAQIDPEVWTEIMNHVFEILSQAIYRHEGTIARLMGDSILAFFGAPVAHEDDPIRAIRAALDMVLDISVYAEELKGQHNIDLAIRAGINSGQVVVGDVGSDLKYEYTAMGDAINVASRLEQTAEPNQIVVSRSIYNATKMFFDFEPLKAVKVKGKEGKVERYLPVGLKEIFQELKGLGYGQLVGRDSEMELIKDLVGAVGEPPLHLSYKGGLLEIKGEAGIGKSRLKYELRQLIKGREISFYQGYCPAYEVPIPYYPFSLILKEVLKLTDGGNEESQKQALADSVKGLGEDLIDTVPYLGAILSLVYEEVAALDDKSRQERIFSSMKRVFERISHQKPSILVFEDTQWIDSLSKSLLAYLIEHSENLPILFCCLYRPEFEPSWSRADRVQISLGVISKEDEVRLIESLLGGLSLPQNLVELILSKSEGNPFYLEEMIRSLMDQGILVKGRRGFELKGEIGQIDIPDTIQGVIMSRLDRLEKRSKETLQYASVIGREFPQRILEEISERGREVEEHLSLLQRLELIFQKQLLPELEYIFKHFLTQEVAYNSILLKKRRELHLKIAKAIEKLYVERLEEYYELLGYHYERAQSWLKATEYFGKAGKKAEEIHSNEITKEHREREEAAYGRLIFGFVLAGIVYGVFLGIILIYKRFEAFEQGLLILTLDQIEHYERFSPLLRILKPVSNILFVFLFMWTVSMISVAISVFAFFKIFFPPWALRKINRHPFPFRVNREAFQIDREDIRISLITLVMFVGMCVGFYLIDDFLKLFKGLSLVAIVTGTLVCMVYGILFWFVGSREGILKTSAKIQIPPLGQAVWIGLHGALAGSLIYNAIRLGFWAIINFELFFRSRMVFHESSTKVYFITGIILIFCWIGLVIGTVLFASSRPDINLKKRLKASSFGWIIGWGSVIIGLMFYYQIMVSKYDYSRDPTQAIRISEIASSNKTVVIFRGNEQPKVVQKPLSAVIREPFLQVFRSYTLDASEGSIQKAIDYLQKRNYTETSLLWGNQHYILQSQILNWDFDSKIEWLYKAAKSSSPFAPYAIQGFMDGIWVSVAKYPKWFKLLEDIAKDKRFYFGLKACGRMGNAYWSFARREDALHWYKKAGLSQQRLEEIQNMPLPFVKGSIKGKILINDKTVPNIKGGVLASITDVSGIVGGSIEVDISGAVKTGLSRIVRASTETDPEGVFRLEHLIEGEYEFALMADEKLIPPDANKVKVINAPGRITINAQNPTVDLGEIKIIAGE